MWGPLHLQASAGRLWRPDVWGSQCQKAAVVLGYRGSLVDTEASCPGDRKGRPEKPSFLAAFSISWARRLGIYQRSSVPRPASDTFWCLFCRPEMGEMEDGAPGPMTFGGITAPELLPGGRLTGVFGPGKSPVGGATIQTGRANITFLAGPQVIGLSERTHLGPIFLAR